MKTIHTKATWLQLTALDKAGRAQLAASPAPPVLKKKGRGVKVSRSALAIQIHSLPKPPAWAVGMAALLFMVGVGGAAMWRGHISTNQQGGKVVVAQPRLAVGAATPAPTLVTIPKIATTMPRGEGEAQVSSAPAAPKRKFTPREHRPVVQDSQNTSTDSPAVAAPALTPSVTIKKVPCTVATGNDCSAAGNSSKEEFLSDKGLEH